MFVNYFLFPQINPVIFSIGPIFLYWYGLMYFFGFIFSIIVLVHRMNTFENFWITKQQELEYILYVSFFALLIGGRVGYMVFYHPMMLYEDIFCVFRIWEGGMSFHGGLIGVIIVWVFFSFYKKYNFFQIADFIVPVVPFGLAAGRLGNFINGELYGRVAINVPWAIFFPNTYDQDVIDSLNYPQWKIVFENYGALPRHPSQLYEMLLEGIILFVIINVFIRRLPPIGATSGLFLLCYGIFRFFIEFFRQPDSHIGLFMEWMSMGQVLSIPMVIGGIIIISASYGLFFKITK